MEIMNKKNQAINAITGLESKLDNNCIYNNTPIVETSQAGLEERLGRKKSVDLYQHQSRRANPKNLIAFRSKAAKMAFRIGQDSFDLNGESYKSVPFRFLSNGKIMSDSIRIGVGLPYGGEPLNGYDERVMLSVCSLVEHFANPEAIGLENKSARIIVPLTLEDIYRAMGKPGKRLQPKESQKIKNSIVKLKRTQIFLEWGSEFKMRRVNADDAVVKYGSSAVPCDCSDSKYHSEYWTDLLPAYQARVVPLDSPSKKAVDGIIVADYPPLYTYSKLTGQIAQIPIDWFDVSCFKRIDDRRNALMWAVCEKIANAQYYRKKKIANPNSSNYNLIPIDAILEGLGIFNRTAKSRTKSDVQVLLTEYQKKSLISDFEWNGSGESIRFNIPY